MFWHDCTFYHADFTCVWNNEVLSEDHCTADIDNWYWFRLISSYSSVYQNFYLSDKLTITVNTFVNLSDYYNDYNSRIYSSYSRTVCVTLIMCSKIVNHMKGLNMPVSETIFNALVKGHIRKGYVKSMCLCQFQWPIPSEHFPSSIWEEFRIYPSHWTLKMLPHYYYTSRKGKQNLSVNFSLSSDRCKLLRWHANGKLPPSKLLFCTFFRLRMAYRSLF